MKSSVNFRIPGNVILFAILFGLTALLLSFFRDFFQENILIPLLRLFWVIGLLIKSLDQVCIWGAGLLLVASFSLFVFFRNTSEHSPQGRTGSLTAVRRARIQFWRNHLRLNSADVIPSRFLSAEMRRLVIEVIAYLYQLNPIEAGRLIREGKIEVPAAVWAVLEIAESPGGTYPFLVNLVRQAWFNLRKWMHPVDPRSLARFEEIAAYLEETLGGTHDLNHR
jgi:hypothetical protein